MIQLRKEMIQNAMGYNKHLVKSTLQEKSNHDLLMNTHPTDRGDFDRRMRKLEEDS